MLAGPPKRGISFPPGGWLRVVSLVGGIAVLRFVVARKADDIAQMRELGGIVVALSRGERLVETLGGIGVGTRHE